MRVLLFIIINMVIAMEIEEIPRIHIGKDYNADQIEGYKELNRVKDKKDESREKIALKKVGIKDNEKDDIYIYLKNGKIEMVQLVYSTTENKCMSEFEKYKIKFGEPDGKTTSNLLIGIMKEKNKSYMEHYKKAGLTILAISRELRPVGSGKIGIEITKTYE